VFGWHAFRPALIGSDPIGIGPERLGEAILGHSQGATFSPDAPADMSIDRRHDPSLTITFVYRYSVVTALPAT
jgi:hypothetical protein